MGDFEEKIELLRGEKRRLAAEVTEIREGRSSFGTDREKTKAAIAARADEIDRLDIKIMAYISHNGPTG
jgi:uncharacterized protein (UPF0335 family)